MAYVIAEPCIGEKDNSCVEVCPVDCIHPTPDEPDYDNVEQLFIDPEECIDCDACVEACPVDACFAEDQLPEEWTKYTEINAPVLQEGRRLDAGASAIGRAVPVTAGTPGNGSPERSCSSGRSCGVAAMRPRAAWRRACAAGRVRVLDHQRHALVGGHAQVLLERHLAEQRHVELVGQLLAAALAEDRDAGAVGRL